MKKWLICICIFCVFMSQNSARAKDRLVADNEVATYRFTAERRIDSLRNLSFPTIDKEILNLREIIKIY